MIMILDALLIGLILVAVMTFIWAVNRRLDIRNREGSYKGRERRLHRA